MNRRRLLGDGSRKGYPLPDIAGMVAAMTEGDPGVESERTSHNILDVCSHFEATNGSIAPAAAGEQQQALLAVALPELGRLHG